MQDLSNLLIRTNAPALIKQTLYRTKEVSKVPKDAQAFKLECLAGGYYQIFLKASKWGLMNLYIGGGTESEPIMKVEHNFSDEESALFYAMYALNREDIGT